MYLSCEWTFPPQMWFVILCYLGNENVHWKALVVNAVAELCEVYLHGLDMWLLYGASCVQLMSWSLLTYILHGIVSVETVLEDEIRCVKFPFSHNDMYCCQIQAVEMSSWTVTQMTAVLGICQIMQQYWLVLVVVGRHLPCMQ